MRLKILHHGNCFDGCASAALFGRFFEELLRIDPSHHIYGLRLNAWVSIIGFIGGATYFIYHQFGGPAVPQRRRRKPEQEEHRPAMAIPKGGKGRVRHGR